MKSQFSGERESTLYDSLAGLVFSTLGTFAIFPASVTKLKFLLSVLGKPGWDLLHGQPVLLSACGMALRLGILVLMAMSQTGQRKEGCVVHLDFGHLCRNFDEEG